MVGVDAVCISIWLLVSTLLYKYGFFYRSIHYPSSPIRLMSRCNRSMSFYHSNHGRRNLPGLTSQGLAVDSMGTSALSTSYLSVYVRGLGSTLWTLIPVVSLELIGWPSIFHVKDLPSFLIPRDTLLMFISDDSSMCCRRMAPNTFTTLGESRTLEQRHVEIFVCFMPFTDVVDRVWETL